MSLFHDALTDLRADAARARELELDRDDLQRELDAACLRELLWKADALAARAEVRRLEVLAGELLEAWQAATHPKPTRGDYDTQEDEWDFLSDAERARYAAYLDGELDPRD